MGDFGNALWGIKAGLDPQDPAIAARFWNCDETAFCTCVSSRKLIA